MCTRTFQYMSIVFNTRIVFNTAMQARLLEAYATTAATIDDAQRALTPLIDEARTLLSIDHSPLVHLEHVITELDADHGDLNARMTHIRAADARVAFLLSTTTGRLVERNLARNALHNGWTYDEALLRRELDALLTSPRPFTAQQHDRITQLHETLAHIGSPFTTSGTTGDLDSNLLDPRIGEPLRIDADTPTNRGRQLLTRALDDTSNPDQILQDEFEVFFHHNGNLTIVLPGVIDLSDPQRGLDPETATLRDLDQHAIASATSTGVEDNGYARRVIEWTETMIETGIITPGTPTTIVGHSFGGDTAFDLTSDSYFNGELLNVTHAISAGYDSQPQLEHLPEHTSALAIGNIFDMVLLGERLARNGGRATDRTTYEAVERGINATTQPLNRFRVNKIPELNLLGEEVITTAPNGLLADFEGGITGAGHHQDEYINYIERVDDPNVAAFLATLDDTGFTNDAIAVSVDISQP